jgi:hypothetical protein
MFMTPALDSIFSLELAAAVDGGVSVHVGWLVGALVGAPVCGLVGGLVG